MDFFIRVWAQSTLDARSPSADSICASSPARDLQIVEFRTCRTVCVCPQTSYPRRYRASSDKGCPKQKKKNSKNPTSQPVFDWLDVVSSRNPTSFFEKSNQFSTGWIFVLEKSNQFFSAGWIFVLSSGAASDRPKIGRWLSFVRARRVIYFRTARPLAGLASAVAPTRATRTRSCSGSSAGDELTAW